MEIDNAIFQLQDGYGKFLGFVWENNAFLFLGGFRMQRKMCLLVLEIL